MLVSRVLTKLQKEFPALSIEKIDILAHPAQALQAGVRMIPTLDAQGERLSGVWLGEGEIRDFVRAALSDDLT